MINQAKSCNLSKFKIFCKNNETDAFHVTRRSSEYEYIRPLVTYQTIRKTALVFFGNFLECGAMSYVRAQPLGTTGGAEVVGDDFAFGAPMINKFHDLDTKTPTNIVGFFFFLNYGYNIGLIMVILLVKLELS